MNMNHNGIESNLMLNFLGRVTLLECDVCT